MSAVTSIQVPPGADETAAARSEAVEFRSRMGRISRQSGVYFAGTLLTTGAGYFFRIYLARFLGAEALGLYALGMSIVGLISLLITFGFPAAAARFIAEYAGRREYSRIGSFLRTMIVLLAGASLLCGALMLAAGPWLAKHFYHSPELARYFWPFTLIMMTGVFTAFFGQVMAGYQDVGRRTLVTHFIGTPANMLFAIALISLGLGLAGYLAAQVMSGLLVLALLARYVWKMTPSAARRLQGPLRLEKRIVSFSAAAFAVAAVEFILTQADKIVLGYYLKPAQVGVYAVAMALVGFVPIALQSVNQIFSPTIAELHAIGDRALLQRLYSTLTKWILALTLPLALTIAVFARPFMGIFGHAFEAGAIVLVVGTGGQVVNCAVGSVGYLLLMSGHQNQIVRIQAVNAVLIIGLSIVLVQRYGIFGAALASAIAVSITNLWSLAVVHRRLQLFPYTSEYFKLLAPVAVTALVLFSLRAFSGAHATWVIATGGVFLAYVAFLGTFAASGLGAEDRILAQAAGERLGLRFWKGAGD